MDRPARSRPGRTPPSGEYAVFHERPYPKQLDRAFRVGATVVGVVADLVFVIWLITKNGQAADLSFMQLAMAAAVPAFTVGLIPAALAYGFTRAVGMIAVGIYGGLQRKQYVVDWDDGSGR